MRPTRREVLQASGLGLAGLALPGRAPEAVKSAASGSEGAAPLANPLRFGANGHPYNSKAYDADAEPGVPYATQVAMLTAMGMDLYRTDIQTDASGRSTNHTKFLTMQDLLADAGIDCLPMLYDNYSPTLSDQENYDRGYAKAAGFATNYGHMFTHYNLGNEWELFKDLLDPELGIGHQAGHYVQPNTTRAMQWIKGANAGLKSVRPTAKTSVAIAGWFPTWWQGYLLDNIDLDFVDWHWYAEMQRLQGNLPGNITNIFDFLWSEYGLPIWVSETNERPSENLAEPDNERRQVDWYNTLYPLALAHPHVEAVILYELLTQPIRTDSYTEANYGLVKFPNFDPANPDHTDWEYKKLPRKLVGADQVIGGFESTSEGWALGLGPEYPGATGSFTRNGDAVKVGAFAGLLSGTFSAGGNYVQISRGLSLDIRELTFWVRSSTLDSVRLRIFDSTGQWHQQRLPLAAGGAWQEIHVDDFDSGLNYQHLGGANDGVWHGPATRVTLVLDKADLVSGTSGSLRFDEIVATTPIP